MKLLVDVSSGYVEESGELTLDGCEREVEHCVLGIPQFGGGPQEDPIHQGLGEHNHVSDDALDESVIHRPERPPDAHDVLSWRCDCFESETGSRAIHPYLDGGDTGLTF
ncbi:hypothetical protein CRG98_032484 [Punica granatum]|uniref:Uncharacterized protein n=1 Tax=Punica granatum TaxID=22663 RepID=A0A2I0IT01_PUNGR|nr:hypothetical protein CRG98_032484 [Punica granatum]